MHEDTKILLDEIRKLSDKGDKTIENIYEIKEEVINVKNRVENLENNQVKFEKLYKFVSSRRFQEVIKKVGYNQTMEVIDKILKKKVGTIPEMEYSEVFEKVLDEKAEVIRNEIEVKKSIVQTISQFFTKKVLAVSILVVIFLILSFSGIVLLFSMVSKFPFLGELIKNLIS